MKKSTFLLGEATPKFKYQLKMIKFGKKIQIFLSEEDEKLLKRASKQESLSLSSFVRHYSIIRAKEVLGVKNGK